MIFPQIGTYKVNVERLERSSDQLIKLCQDTNLRLLAVHLLSCRLQNLAGYLGEPASGGHGRPVKRILVIGQRSKCEPRLSSGVNR